ncbi:MAG: HAMP domain-containing histidine kinase [Lachnospiraceae bacterium]|nr:HAMP domain-containing histidine kinase [Lachnospiraceae bacterium]
MRTKRRRKLWPPVVTGFAVLYLMSMGLATYLMKTKYAEEFKSNASLRLSAIQQQTQNDQTWKTDSDYYSYLASQIATVETSGPYQQFSVAFYQTDGRLLAKTQERIGVTSFTEDSETLYNYRTLEHLTQEETAILAKYGQLSKNSHNPSGAPPKYRFLMRTAKDSGKLCQILVQEVTWAEDSEKPTSYEDPVTKTHYSYENEQGNDYTQTHSQVVWERNYPDDDKKTWEENQTKIQEASLLFPYLFFNGYDQWRRWSLSEYLQAFDNRIDISSAKIERTLTRFSQDSYQIQEKDRLYTYIWANNDANSQPTCYAELRFESHPWLAAMDYLKYEYLAGLALMIACIAKVLHVTSQTYRQRAALEEMRRDFTNAMAHELKTPLGIIRGFAENLQEHHMEHKREYYLSQIIGQTEEIDRLVTEMIDLSKMDEKQLTLQRETVSMRALIQEQIQRLTPMIQEKNLQIQYDCDKDFLLDGDPGYLAKAVANLLSNAVLYNAPGGNIRITTDATRCSIENTTEPLTQEQLTHAFDMFYSGDKNRGLSDKHRGLGLFLTKKILALHRLNITLQNTPMGVQAQIERNSPRR